MTAIDIDRQAGKSDIAARIKSRKKCVSCSPSHLVCVQGGGCSVHGGRSETLLSPRLRPDGGSARARTRNIGHTPQPSTLPLVMSGRTAQTRH